MLRRQGSNVFVFVCRQGPELRNQITEGDPGRHAEGQHGLWDIYQGEDAVILHSAVNCTFIKTMNFVLQDYESDLAAYTSGLETLLNIPIKRTMLKSPAVDLNQEVSDWKEQQTIFACRSSYFFAFCCLRLRNCRRATWSCSPCLQTTTGSWETCSKTWRS